VIEIRPPLSIINLLGGRISYELFSKEKLQSGDIDRGQKIIIYTTDLTEDIYIKCKPKKYVSLIIAANA
jgi:hypothetical protein